MLGNVWVGVGFLKINKGKLLISHRYNLSPLLHSCPGGVHRELVAQDLPLRPKVRLFLKNQTIYCLLFLVIFVQILRMQRIEKEFLLNRGLYLGIFLSFFPIIDLLFGENMTLKTYYLVFYGLWFIITTFLILFFGKEYRSHSNFFNFKSAFRIMFIVAVIGFTLLTVTRITLWNVFYPEKYIELNETRDSKLTLFVLGFSQSSLDKAYRNGSLSDEEYEESMTIIQNQIIAANEIIEEKWNSIKQNGISKTLFIVNLITNLFFMIILNAILALIIRRKHEIA